MSDPQLKILQKEREGKVKETETDTFTRLVEVSVEQRLPAGSWILCQLSVFCILCGVSIKFAFHVKVE